MAFDGVVQRPRPVQRPHPPLVLGGHSPRAYRRAVRYGNGWYGWDLDPDQAAEAVPPPRNSPLWSPWVGAVQFGTYLWLGCVPFPLGAVDSHGVRAGFSRRHVFAAVDVQYGARHLGGQA